MWDIKIYTYFQTQSNKKKKWSPLCQTTAHYHFKLDFQNVVQHTLGIWLIHGTKHREDNHLHNLELFSIYVIHSENIFWYVFGMVKWKSIKWVTQSVETGCIRTQLSLFLDCSRKYLYPCDTQQIYAESVLFILWLPQSDNTF